MTIADLLPMLPWEGPPLPKFLGIIWPWLRAGERGLPLLSLPRNYISDITTPEPSLTTYENIEEIEFPNGFDPETFMPRKIVIHRKAKENR